MRFRRGFSALLIALLFLSPSIVFAKGKKPPPSDVEELPPEEESVEDAPMLEAEDGTEAPASIDAADTETENEVPQKAQPPRSVVSETPAEAPEGSIVHTVWVWQESRDCLWKLAKLYYKDPWQWKRIYLQNRNTILDPNLIFPKQRIIIPDKTSAQ